MEADTQAQLAFFLTGRRSGAHLDAVDGLDLRPALFAGYRQLTQLRHDFPLVLVAGCADQQLVQTLCGIIDHALGVVAVGEDSARIRKQVLRLEQEIRTLAADGEGGTLVTLWTKAAERMLTANDADPALERSLNRARAAIKLDGVVLNCDAAMPARLLRHGWTAVENQKAAKFRKGLDRLILKLSDILKADLAHSASGRGTQQLKASFGSGYDSAFDFEAMSRLLNQALPGNAFPETRRERIRALLAVLGAQAFFPPTDGTGGSAGTPYQFAFERCADALAAFRERMPRLIALAKAIAVAELEIEGQYNESRHDGLFEHFGENGLDPQDLAAYPDYLVSVNAEKMQADEHSQLMEILASDLPIKVLLQVDDILEPSANGDGNMTVGMRSRQIANMAIGLNEVYVLQSSSSNLFRFRERILRGLNFRGPALFSVFSGASGEASGLPAYLTSAAAMESRAFPAFTYDPSAGPNWAARFYLDANSQVDLDWPIQSFGYEDQQHQRVLEDLAFTLIDFIAGDRRYGRHFARVPQHQWNGSMIPVDESLTRERRGLPDKVPSLLMIDADNVLQKVIVDQRLIREARRCREMWHSLQELGGIHNSHAEKLLARERKAWEARVHQEADAPAVVVPATPAVPLAPAAESAAAEPVAEPAADGAYIETARCSTCDECIQINSKMFAYDRNKQAYIVDIDAGSYAQLVEAAESCQVSVIHPGKPRNPAEAGLDELLKRAEPFQ